MDTKLKFEFDFDEVFEGIKQGVIRELEEMNFNAVKDNVVNQVKTEIKSKIALTYSDERELKDEIKNEIKEKVYNSLIEGIGDKYADKFNEYMVSQLSQNPTRLNLLLSDIKREVSENLYYSLYSSIREEVIGKVKDTTANLCDLLSGNTVKVEGLNKTITRKEYEDLIAKDRKLSELLSATKCKDCNRYGDELHCLICNDVGLDGTYREYKRNKI